MINDVLNDVKCSVLKHSLFYQSLATLNYTVAYICLNLVVCYICILHENELFMHNKKYTLLDILYQPHTVYYRCRYVSKTIVKLLKALTSFEQHRLLKNN